MLSKDLLKQLISTRQKKSYFDNPIDQRVRYIVVPPTIIPSSLKAVRKMTK